MSTYQSLDETLGNKQKKVMHRSSSRGSQPMNTWLERHPGDLIVVHFVESEIMRFFPDGTIVLSSNGWQTVTTKKRLNDYLPRPWAVWQKKGLWYLVDWQPPVAIKYGWNDGITIRPDGSVSNHIDNTDGVNLKKQIDKYAKKFAKEFVAGNVPAPESGDCWYCHMRTVDGDVPLGEAVKNKDHLLSHMEEGYLVPSLLMNAIQDYGESHLSIWSRNFIHERWVAKEEEVRFSNWNDIVVKQVCKTLKVYLYRQFDLPA